MSLGRVAVRMSGHHVLTGGAGAILRTRMRLFSHSAERDGVPHEETPVADAYRRVPHRCGYPPTTRPEQTQRPPPTANGGGRTSFWACRGSSEALWRPGGRPALRPRRWRVCGRGGGRPAHPSVRLRGPLEHPQHRGQPQLRFPAFAVHAAPAPRPVLMPRPQPLIARVTPRRKPQLHPTVASSSRPSTLLGTRRRTARRRNREHRRHPVPPAVGPEGQPVRSAPHHRGCAAASKSPHRWRAASPVVPTLQPIAAQDTPSSLAWSTR